jgi:hypothetical protein
VRLSLRATRPAHLAYDNQTWCKVKYKKPWLCWFKKVIWNTSPRSLSVQFNIHNAATLGELLQWLNTFESLNGYIYISPCSKKLVTLCVQSRWLMEIAQCSLVVVFVQH